MTNIDASTAVRDRFLEGLKSNPNRAQLEAVLAESLSGLIQDAPTGSPAVADAFAIVAFGAMRAYLLQGRDLTESSVRILGLLVEAGGKVKADPQFVMRSSLPGLARAALAGPPGAANNMRYALDDAFHGVGQAFAESYSRLLPSRLS